MSCSCNNGSGEISYVSFEYTGEKEGGAGGEKGRGGKEGKEERCKTYKNLRDFIHRAVALTDVGAGRPHGEHQRSFFRNVQTHIREVGIDA